MAKSITQKQLKKLEKSLQCIIGNTLECVIADCDTIDDIQSYSFEVNTDMVFEVLNACGITELKYKNVCRESLENFDMYGLLYG